ncbi:MAG: hydroxymethylbilane synthase [Vicinamibacterales bacterium]
MKPRRIGTRGSALALWQAKTVAAELERRGMPTEIVVIKTGGDRLQEAPLSEAGGKRLFVKELEDALLSRDIDLAVHSAKDMSAVLPDGLTIAAALPREDPRDALVLARGTVAVNFEAALAHIGEMPSIATSSIRRIAQLSAVLPHARFTPIRGNVDTRLRKLDAGEYEALVLAAAGLKRLGFAARVSAAIPPELCIPAPGQGIVAIEIREGDRESRDVVAAIGDRDAALSLAAERAVVTALGGGCQLPLGAIAVQDRGSLTIHAVVAWPDGHDAIRRTIMGPSEEAETLGRTLAEELQAGGAADILSAARNSVTG